MTHYLARRSVSVAFGITLGFGNYARFSELRSVPKAFSGITLGSKKQWHPATVGAPIPSFVCPPAAPSRQEPGFESLIRDEPEVAAYFQDARLEIDDPHVLKDVIEEIDQISFAQLSPDVRGDVFEYLLLCLSKTQLPQLGEFRTPPQIRKLMVEVVDPDFGDTIYDPACGTGGLVVDAVGRILAKYSSSPIEVPIYGESWLESQGGKSVVELKKTNPNLQTYYVGSGDRLPDWRRVEASLFGNDVSPSMVRIARMNLLLHGFPHARIRCANSLSDTGGLTEDDLERRYQVICAATSDGPCSRKSLESSTAERHEDTPSVSTRSSSKKPPP